MAKNDFIFVDESGDTGYKLDPETGELLNSPYYELVFQHPVGFCYGLVYPQSLDSLSQRE